MWTGGIRSRVCRTTPRCCCSRYYASRPLTVLHTQQNGLLPCCARLRLALERAGRRQETNGSGWRVHRGIHVLPRSAARLEPIRAAMKAWRRAGERGDLHLHHLQNYMKKEPKGPKPPGGKSKPPPRWRSAGMLTNKLQGVACHMRCELPCHLSNQSWELNFCRGKLALLARFYRI